MAGGDPLRLSRITVLLPTRRAARSLREAFLRLTGEAAGGAPLLLPRMRPIGDLDADELDFDALQLRATAQWDGERVAALPADASLADLAGGAAQGRLALTLDPRDAGTLYQGIVSLDATSVAASIEHYLATSEQLPSRLWLRRDEGGVTRPAAAAAARRDAPTMRRGARLARSRSRRPRALRAKRR